MKKESIVRKIFVSSLIGFPIGVTLLMLAYISIFCISGEDIANNELTQLHNVRTLFFQVIAIGLTYFIVFININTISLLKNKETTNKFMSKHPYITVILSIIISLWLILSIQLICNESLYSKNIATVNCVTIIIIYAIISLFFMIKDIIENLLVKKINIKIKEKNNN